MKVADELVCNWMSGDWIAVATWAQARLADKRSQLENPLLDQNGAQVLRGEIKILKDLLAQPDLAAQEQPGVGPDWD